MFQYSKEMKWIISFIVLLLDGIIVYYSEISFNHLNYFYPMLSISLLPFLNCRNERKYYVTCFILGLFYDLLYSNIFLYHAIIFILLGIIDNYILIKFKNNLFLFLILIIINILTYDCLNYFLVIITNYHLVNISDLVYKIIHSLIINIMFGFGYFFLFKKRFF